MSRPSKFDAAIDTLFGQDTGHEEPPVDASEKVGFRALAFLCGLSMFVSTAAVLALLARCAG